MGDDMPSDSELLEAARRGVPDAFAEFYRRHLPAVVGYLRQRTAEPELIADLTAEVFAAALGALHSGRAAGVSEHGAWLQTIARNKLIDSQRRGRVAAEARSQLGLEPLAFYDEDIERVDALASEGNEALRIAARLPEDQWQALHARVIEEREYGEIADELGISEFVVRKRVSRALANLRIAWRRRP
jgi:RNA polymerase sigma-70 factor (ECF subfamily)